MPKSSSEQFVESFLSQAVGESKSQEALGKLRFQTMLLDPPHKAPKLSSSSAHPRPHKLTTREKRKLRLHDIPHEQQRYEDFTPLHQLWLGYMEDLLQLKTTPTCPSPSSSSSAKK